jgi:hypothetical protein
MQRAMTSRYRPSTRHVRLLSAAVATATLLIPAATQSVHASNYPPRVPAGTFGMNIQGLLFMSSAQRLPLMASLRSAGIDVVRVDAYWQEVEPQAPDLSGVHTYNWSLYDSLETDLASKGIRWQPMSNMSSYWAATCIESAPYPWDIAQYANFAAQVAQRYGGEPSGFRGDFWRSHPSLTYLPATRYEIWNEENLTPPCGVGFTAATYDTLFSQSASAIRAVDPQAQVIVGGLSQGGTAAPVFAQEMVAASPTIVSQIDGWGLHPYYHTPAGAVSEPIALAVGFRQALSQVMVPLREGIYLTEIGWTTGGNGPYFPAIPDSGPFPDRADALVQTSDQLTRSNCNVAQYVVHTWITPEKNTANEEDWFGIANADGTLKASAQAWSNEVNLLYGNGSSAPPSGVVSLC